MRLLGMLLAACLATTACAGGREGSVSASEAPVGGPGVPDLRPSSTGPTTPRETPPPGTRTRQWAAFASSFGWSQDEQRAWADRFEAACAQSGARLSRTVTDDYDRRLLARKRGRPREVLDPVTFAMFWQAGFAELCPGRGPHLTRVFEDLQSLASSLPQVWTEGFSAPR